MAQLRVYKGDALLGELDFVGNHVEIGDRPGDAIRWDELGLAADPGWGGRLERRANDAWVFVPRVGDGSIVLAAGERLPVGDGTLEILAPEDQPVVDVARLPPDEAQPVALDTVRAEPGSAESRLHHLAELLREVEQGSTSEQVLSRALDGAFELVQAERGIAALSTGKGQGLRVVAARNFGAEDPQSSLSRRVLSAVLDEGKDVFTSNAPVEIPTVSISLSAIRAICALPLRVGGRIGGVLYVDRGPLHAPFSDEDLAFLQLLAGLVSRRLETEARLAASEKERRRLAGRLAHKEVEDERDLAWGSPAMQRVRREGERLLRVFQGGGLPVLITGESGTGKEVLARWLHDHLEGDAGAFVAVNCAAIPKDLAESELFGIEQGVASGVLRRIGKFQQADGGTLFLDEVGEMDLAIQTKLLRVLESQRIVRVGGREEIPVNVRVVSATNASLEDAITAGTFREDLFWRLCGVQIRMPLLRDRREDIPALCEVFLRRFTEEFGLPSLRIEPEAMAALQAYHWPGNVRELRQRIGALVALSDGGNVTLADLPASLRDPSAPAGRPRSTTGDAAAGSPPPPAGALQSLAVLEQDHIRRVLDEVGGNLTRAAEILGIHKKTLRRKLDRG